MSGSRAQARGVQLRRLRPALVLAAKLGGSLLFFLAILELGVRVVHPQLLTSDLPGLYVMDEALSWRRAANVRDVIRKEGRDVPFCTDARGDRVSCDAPAPRACARRILVLGDSWVEALQVPYEDTLWARLARDADACIEVTGVGGYGIAQYREVLRARLAEVPAASYDLVLLNIYAGNDMGARAEEMPPVNIVERARFRWLPESLSGRDLAIWLRPLNQALESYSHAWVAFRNVVRARLGSDFVQHSLRPSQFGPDDVDGTIGAVARIVALAREAAVPIHVTLIPTQSQVRDPRGVALRAQAPSVGDDLDMDLPSKRVAPRLDELADGAFLDLLPPLRGRATAETWGEFDVHFSPAGHALWYEIAREPILGLLRGAPAAPPSAARSTLDSR